MFNWITNYEIPVQSHISNGWFFVIKTLKFHLSLTRASSMNFWKSWFLLVLPVQHYFLDLVEVWWKSWGLYSTILFFTLLWTLFWCVLFGFSQSLNLCIVAPCFLLTWLISCVLWSTTSCRTEVLPFTGCVDNIGS